MFKTVCALAMATLSQASDLTDSLTAFSQDASSFIEDITDITVDIMIENDETTTAVASIIEDTVYQGALIYDFMDKMGAGPGCAAHCTKQAYACAADAVCKQNLECVAGNCDISNSTCTFICSESYMSPKIDDLMSCMFVEYECA